jgi:hypothetical protein
LLHEPRIDEKRHSMIRARLAKGESITIMVAPAVARLYHGEGAVPQAPFAFDVILSLPLPPNPKKLGIRNDTPSKTIPLSQRERGRGVRASI